MARKRIPAISAKRAYATLDVFLKSTSAKRPLTDHLRTIVERERDTLYLHLGNHEDPERYMLAAPGPVTLGPQANVVNGRVLTSGTVSIDNNIITR